MDREEGLGCHRWGILMLISEMRIRSRLVVSEHVLLQVPMNEGCCHCREGAMGACGRGVTLSLAGFRTSARP